VVAGFYPLAFLAQRVGGPEVSVRNLTEAGAEPHDLELTPRRVQQVATADLVLYVRGFQPAVDDAVEEHGRRRSLDMTTLAGNAVRPGDPHLWLDPTLMARFAEEVDDRLARLDRAGEPRTQGRAHRLGAELRALDNEYRAGLAQCAQRTIVTAHDAFGYLAARYGLREVGIAGLSPEAEPSPARIAEVAAVARREGVRTVFYEGLVDPAVARVVAREVGARTAVLDPVEGVARGEDYFTVMRRNLGTLRQALRCR
jgi:zinc transport system substrate-binding protein